MEILLDSNGYDTGNHCGFLGTAFLNFFGDYRLKKKKKVPMCPMILRDIYTNQGKTDLVHDQDVLVGGLVDINFIFPYIGNVIIPTDELIFFRGVAQPPTSVPLQPFCVREWGM